MNIPHVDAVKDIIGENILLILNTLFNDSGGVPAVVNAKRFRADHPDWMDELDKLGWSEQLLGRSKDREKYTLKVQSLPLLNSPDADELISCMEKVFNFFREYYNECLDEPLPMQDILCNIDINESILTKALCYMCDVHGWWSGIGQNFPFDEDSNVVISEEILKYESFGNLLGQIYEWHYINPKKRASVTSHNLIKTESPSKFFDESSNEEQPEWFLKLDHIQRALINEVDIALRANLSALPTIGLRTLLELIMTEKVGDNGSFIEKLNRFKEQELITRTQAEHIEKVLDAGHAAAHRASFPNVEDIDTCVDVIIHLMQSIYILGPKIQKLVENTPPDPRKK